jgi:hypothetical protein
VLASSGLPFWNPRNVPSGSSTEVENAYYQYLWHNLLHGGGYQQVSVQSEFSNLFLVLTWTLIIALLGYILTNSTYYQQNKRGAATDPNGPEIQDLYPVESYNGIITERNGGVDTFNWVLYALMTVWTLGLMFFAILNGQIY